MCIGQWEGLGLVSRLRLLTCSSVALAVKMDKLYRTLYIFEMLHSCLPPQVRGYKTILQKKTSTNIWINLR